MKLKKLMLTSLAVLLAGCSGGSSTYTIESDAPYGLAGMIGKKNYVGLTSTPITEWNYLGSQEAADASHFANFVDGLILHNEFGVLEKNLAEKVTKSENNKVFTFTVKEGVKWMTAKGNQYKANGKAQYVQASDWVTTAKYICTYTNNSPLLNFYIIFIKGAAEYYFWTYIKDKAARGDRAYSDIVDNHNYTKGAKELMKLIKENYPAVYETAGYDDTPITADDIPSIDDFSRIGVRADDSKRQLVYELFTEAFYFPTVLTYSAFLPTNQAFIDSVRASAFGSDNDKILYNGPYINSHYDDNTIVYTKNPEYHNPKIVHLDKITYNLIPSTEKNAYLYMRQQYESGNIDGCTLDPKDEVGWDKYIVGPDGEGTRENPYNGSVNARFLDTIGSMYGSNINMMRYTNNGNNPKSYAGKDNSGNAIGNKYTIKNTENAFKLSDVRRLVLNAIDYDSFTLRYSNGEPDEILQSQYQVSTYTPLNFVQDDDGGDYVSTHLYEKYAEAHPDTCPDGAGDPENPVEGTAAYALRPGQYETRKLSDEQVSDLAVKAVKAIKLYNALPDVEQITFPINIETYSGWFNDDEKEYDTKAIRDMNRRANSQAACEEAGIAYEAGKNLLFNYVPTKDCTEDNYNEISGSGTGNGAQYDYSPVLWGWGADYGDPLTYMGTYIKGGDWKDIFKFVESEYVQNFDVVEGALVESDLLAEYTRKVNEAMKITADVTERYARFAECEMMLLDDLAIYVPQVNYGQGWSISISRSAGYATPSANYGLASDRMTGVWCLETALTGEQRVEMRRQFQEAKEAYTKNHPVINIYD